MVDCSRGGASLAALGCLRWHSRSPAARAAVVGIRSEEFCRGILRALLAGALRRSQQSFPRARRVRSSGYLRYSTVTLLARFRACPIAPRNTAI